MPSIRIIFLCISAAVAYGIIHDEITARICVEYFTIGHPPVFRTDSPTLLGLGWGVIATWWVGVMLGVPLALAATAGERPKQNAGSLIRPVAILLMVMAGVAVVAGTVGYNLAVRGWVYLAGSMASDVPADKQNAFIADLWSHSASYLVGFVGGIVLIVRTWRGRSGSPV